MPKETPKTKANREEAPLKVSVVPDDGLTDQQRADKAASNEPANVENRNASYLPAREGVDQERDEG